MKNIKKIFFSILIFSTFTCIGANEPLTKINEEITKGLEPIISSLPTNQSLIVAAHLYPIVKDAFQYCFPTQEQQASATIATERLAFFKARANFRTCLFDSKKESERSILNAPKHCQELVIAFMKLDGTDEAMKMIQNFDKHWK